MTLSKITLVTLDNFYVAAENPMARRIFGELVLLRLRGFGPDYPDTYLPVDAADYVCRQHLFCAGEGENLEPFAGFRQVPPEPLRPLSPRDAPAQDGTRIRL